MTIDAAVGLFRRLERRDFRSTCTVTRAAAGRTFNPTTNAYTSSAPATIYAGDCMVRRTDRSGNDTEAGEREVRIQDLEVKLPADTAVAEGDDITITASPDPALVGKTLKVTGVLSDDWQISRLVAVEEVVRR